MGPGGDVARVAALSAGLPLAVPALTVDRQCGSGLAAVTSGPRAGPRRCLGGGRRRRRVGLDRAVAVLAPVSRDGEPVRYDRAPFAPAAVGDPDMGLAADLLAEHGVDRSGRTPTRHARTPRGGHPGARRLRRGDRPGGRRTRRRAPAGRADRRATRTAPAPPPSRRHGHRRQLLRRERRGGGGGGRVDAGTHRELGVPGLRILATATAGVDPNRPGLGIVPATGLALARAGLTLDDLDVVELNEAFAGQVLACCDELAWTPNGSASRAARSRSATRGGVGAVLVVRLFSQLVRAGRGRYGLAAIAAGGGQGVAVVVERCP